jgi:signal-transduction protein with cAMP-binding, CBS, and nucleotidyltransferase domain
MVMHARDLMIADVLTVDASLTVRATAQRMATEHKGYALVRRDGQPWGIATEWDFISKVLAPSKDPSVVTVGEIATAPIVTMDADTPTDELVASMAAQGVRRIVLTSGGHVVGVVTSKEVVRAFQKYVDQVSSDIARLHTPPM